MMSDFTKTEEDYNNKQSWFEGSHRKIQNFTHCICDGKLSQTGKQVYVSQPYADGGTSWVDDDICCKNSSDEIFYENLQIIVYI